MSSRSPAEPVVVGTLWGFASAVGYTAANACLRAASHCDPIWVSTVKAFPTAALVAPLVLYRLARGHEQLPPWPKLRILIGTAVVCQLLGNVVFQWSLGIIGMALTVPLTLGMMIVGAAVMGRLFLYEPVTPAMALSMSLLVGSVFVLSWGARESTQAADAPLPPGKVLPARDATEAGRAGGERSEAAGLDHSVASPSSVAMGMAGVAAACVAGLAYSLLGVVIRSVVTGSMSVAMSMVTVTATGVVALGSASLISPGLPVILETVPADLLVMLMAGLFNLVAFLSLTKSLQLIPVARVNALNASQAAMGALAGIVIFAEPSSWPLWLGLGMTVLGLLLMRRPGRSPRPLERQTEG